MLFRISTNLNFHKPRILHTNSVLGGKIMFQHDHNYQMMTQGNHVIGMYSMNALNEMVHYVSVNNTIDDNAVQLTTSDYPLFQLYEYSDGAVTNFKVPRRPCTQLHPLTKCIWDYDGVMRKEMREDAYVPPVTGENLTCAEVAEQITFLLRARLHQIAALECSEGNVYDFYFSGGLDTGVLKAIILQDDLPINVIDDYSGQLFIAEAHRTQTKAQQRFMGIEHEDFANMPPWSRHVITGFYGGVEIVRWPDIMRGLFTWHGMDYDKIHAANMDSYLGKFLNNSGHQASNKGLFPGMNIKTETTLDDVRWYADDVLMHTAETWTVDQMEAENPFRQRDIHWWVTALAPKELVKQAFHSEVHKEIIRQTYPDVLKQVDKYKE